MKLIDLSKPKLRFGKARSRLNAWIEDRFTGIKGIDISELGTGHLSCPKCSHVFWGVDVQPGKTKVKTTCWKCGYGQDLYLPFDVYAPQLHVGIPSCPRKHDEGYALIKSDETFCIGCRRCDFEIRIIAQVGNKKVFKI